MPARPERDLAARGALLDDVFVRALADGACRLRVVADVVVEDAVFAVLHARPRVVDARAREREELETRDVELRVFGEKSPSLLVLQRRHAAVRRETPDVEAKLPELVEPVLD